MKRAKPKSRAPKPAIPEAPSVTVHKLKAVPETFDPIASGERKFDIRLDDRGFRVGHVIEYRRYDRDMNVSTATLKRTIGYLLYGLDETACLPNSQARWGLKGSYVAIGFKD